MFPVVRTSLLTEKEGEGDKQKRRVRLRPYEKSPDRRTVEGGEVRVSIRGRHRNRREVDSTVSRVSHEDSRDFTRDNNVTTTRRTQMLGKRRNHVFRRL